MKPGVVVDSVDDEGVVEGEDVDAGAEIEAARNSRAAVAKAFFNRNWTVKFRL